MIATDPTATHPLTRHEMVAEMEVASEHVRWGLARLGEDIEISMTWNCRFTRRLGDATISASGKARIRLSSSALWRRATPEQRRIVVLHELAHIVANVRATKRAGHLVGVGHGLPWKLVMVCLGLCPDRQMLIPRNGIERKASSGSRPALPPLVANMDARVDDFSPGARVAFRFGRQRRVGVVEGAKGALLLIASGQAIFEADPRMLVRCETKRSAR